MTLLVSDSELMDEIVQDYGPILAITGPKNVGGSGGARNERPRLEQRGEKIC